MVTTTTTERRSRRRRKKAGQKHGAIFTYVGPSYAGVMGFIDVLLSDLVPGPSGSLPDKNVRYRPDEQNGRE